MSGVGILWAAAAASATPGPAATGTGGSVAQGAPAGRPAATDAAHSGPATPAGAAHDPPGASSTGIAPVVTRAEGSQSTSAALRPSAAAVSSPAGRASFSLSALPAALQQVQAMIKRGTLLGSSSTGTGSEAFAPLTSSTTVVKPQRETGPYVPGAPVSSYTSPLEEDLPQEVRQCIAWLQAGGSRWDSLVRTLAMENAVLKNAADRESSEATRLRLELTDTAIRAQALEHTASLQEREIRRLAGIVLDLTSGNHQLELGMGGEEDDEGGEDEDEGEEGEVEEACGEEGGALRRGRSLLALQEGSLYLDGGDEAEAGSEEAAVGDEVPGVTGIDVDSSGEAGRLPSEPEAGTVSHAGSVKKPARRRGREGPAASVTAAPHGSAAAAAAAAFAAVTGAPGAGTTSAAVTDQWWFADQPDTTLLPNNPARVPPATWITGTATAATAGGARHAAATAAVTGGSGVSSGTTFSEPEAAALVAAVAADEGNATRPGHGSAQGSLLSNGAHLKLAALAALTGGALTSTVSAVPSKLRAALASALGGSSAAPAPAPSAGASGSEPASPPRPTPLNTEPHEGRPAPEAPPLSARSNEGEGGAHLQPPSTRRQSVGLAPSDSEGRLPSAAEDEEEDAAPPTCRSGSSPEPGAAATFSFKDWAVESVDGATPAQGSTDTSFVVGGSAEAPLSPSKRRRRAEEGGPALRGTVQRAFTQVMSPRGWLKGGGAGDASGTEAAAAGAAAAPSLPGSTPPTPTAAAPALSFTSSARKSIASTIGKGKALARPLGKAKSPRDASAASGGGDGSGTLPGFTYASRPPGLRRRLARLVSQIEVLLPSAAPGATSRSAPLSWNTDFLRAKLRELLADLDEMGARHSFAAAARVEGGPATPLPWLQADLTEAAAPVEGLWTTTPPGVAPGSRAAALASASGGAVAAGPATGEASPVTPGGLSGAGMALPVPGRPAAAPSPGGAAAEAPAVAPPVPAPLSLPIQVLTPEAAAAWYNNTGAGARGRRSGAEPRAGGSDASASASASGSGSGSDGEGVAGPALPPPPPASGVATAALASGLYPLHCQVAGSRPAPLKYPSTPLPPGAKGRGLRILSMDGGGIRGLLGLEVLRRLERETQRPIYELFDLLAGTSTGGFLAMNLAYRRPLDEIAAHYDKVRSTFSGQSAFITGLKRFATGNSHSAAAADAILKDAFGEQPLASLPPLPKVLLVSCAVDMFPIQPYLLTSYALSPAAQRAAEFHRTCNTTCANAVRATTSAPGFYEPARVGGHRMVDGALVANNPSAVALAEAALLWPGAPIDVFVSLGTGMQKLRPWGWQDVAGPGVIVKWVQTVLDLCTNSYVVHRAVSTILGPCYHRFDPYGRLDDGFGIGDVDLDETDINVLSMMLREGRRYIERSEPQFKRVAAALLSSASPQHYAESGTASAPTTTTAAAAAAAPVTALHAVPAPGPAEGATSAAEP